MAAKFLQEEAVLERAKTKLLKYASIPHHPFLWTRVIFTCFNCFRACKNKIAKIYFNSSSSSHVNQSNLYLFYECLDYLECAKTKLLKYTPIPHPPLMLAKGIFTCSMKIMFGLFRAASLTISRSGGGTIGSSVELMKTIGTWVGVCVVKGYWTIYFGRTSGLLESCGVSWCTGCPKKCTNRTKSESKLSAVGLNFTLNMTWEGFVKNDRKINFQTQGVQAPSESVHFGWP